MHGTGVKDFKGMEIGKSKDLLSFPPFFYPPLFSPFDVREKRKDEVRTFLLFFSSPPTPSRIEAK